MRLFDVLSNPLSRLRLMGVIEGSSLLLLGIAMPLKYVAGLPVATSVMGPVHGLAFILYGVALVDAISGGGWSGRDIARAALASIVPFGTFANDGLVRRKLAEAGEA